MPRGFATMSPALPDARNYHRWVFSLMQPWIGDSVLEIGFGYGQYSRELSGRCRTLVGIDLFPPAQVPGLKTLKNAQFLQADVSRRETLTMLESPGFSTVVMLNVLEHIEDDVQALKNLHSLMKPQGRLLLLLPAFSALFGPLDACAGHFRRYEAVAAAHTLRKAGFRVQEWQYVNPIGGVGWWINGNLFRPDSLSDPQTNAQIRFFDRYLVPFSKVLTRLFHRYFGQSLWIVASPEAAPPLPGRVGDDP